MHLQTNFMIAAGLVSLVASQSMVTMDTTSYVTAECSTSGITMAAASTPLTTTDIVTDSTTTCPESGASTAAASTSASPFAMANDASSAEVTNGRKTSTTVVMVTITPTLTTTIHKSTEQVTVTPTSQTTLMSSAVAAQADQPTTTSMIIVQTTYCPSASTTGGMPGYGNSTTNGTSPVLPVYTPGAGSSAAAGKLMPGWSEMLASVVVGCAAWIL